SLLCVLAALLSLTACQPEEPDVVSEQDIETALAEATMDADYEEIDALSVEAMDVTDISAAGRDFSNADLRMIPACATITHDSVNKVITIDFGTGCVGPYGRERKGKIILTYTQRLYVPGSTLTIELENYSVNDVAIEGTKTITNLASSWQDPISFNTTLVGGQVTWLNGDVSTREFSRTRTWVRGVNPLLDEFHIDGTASGMRRTGVSYQTTVLSTLIVKRACRVQGVRIPVEGQLELKVGNRPTVLVDFGDGTCDHLITVEVNGHTRVIDVSNP
ncbi:MAG: hypothetical protein AAFV07_05870, partial [Bacteroidota bacterium]